MTDAAFVRATAARVAASADALRALGPRVVDVVVEAGARLADPDDPLGAAALTTLPRSTAHSREMIAWALRTTCSREATASLAAVAARKPGGAPRGLAALVLAGNVFTSSFRPAAFALVAGVPVLAKAPSRDDVFPRLLGRALREVDARVGAAFDVVSFRGGDLDCEDALFAASDVVFAYGSDDTLATLRRHLPARTTLEAHGHGLGAAYVGASALGDRHIAHEAARGLALDVAAYDQCGCLSPQLVFVARYGHVSPRNFAAMLADELSRVAEALPRGSLPVELGARQLQWRGVAAARGELFEGDGFAVAYEADAALRLGPGFRNVLVLEAGDERDAAQRLAPLGAHLKVLGVFGGTFTAELAPPLAPRVCALGTMQTPAFDAPWDGRAPFDGLFRD